MRSVRRRTRVGTVVVSIAAVIFSAGGASAQTVGGIADVGTAQEPACLNPYSFSCFAFDSVAGLALAGAYRQLPNLTYEPSLVASVEMRRGAITYQLKSAAEWSDDVPVSADDLIFTFETIMNPANNILDRAGYDLIKSATKVNAKTVRFVFSRPYARWKALFPHVLPKHVLQGKDFDTVWTTFGTNISDPDTSLPIGSGPFLTTSWVTGNRIELSRNANWWGPHAPYLDGVFFRFILDTNTRIAALTAGTVELVDEAGASLPFIDLYDDPGIVADWHPAFGIEHVMFSASSPTKPLLQQPWFRQAVSYAFDRAASVPAVYGTAAPGLGPHQSLLYLSQQPEYKPNFARYQYNVGTVATIMTSHGCALGGDSVWSCDGQRASLRFGTTTGNALRAQMQDQLQAQALAAGIELVDDNFSAVDLFTRLNTRNFDLIMFRFIDFFGDPFGAADVWGCGGTQNFSDYCSPAATAFLSASDQELSLSYRAFLVNRADSSLAAGLPAIPLFQSPGFLAYRDELHGVVANAFAGATWNAEDWYLDP